MAAVNVSFNCQVGILPKRGADGLHIGDDVAIVGRALVELKTEVQGAA
jgi:hypothetical protein